MENTLKINRLIDHTLLKPEATEAQLIKLCEEAIKYDFFSVCINPSYVKKAHSLLKNSKVLVCTVIGFPLGANSTATKVFETKEAILNGASECDMVINIGAVKNQQWDLVESDIAQVVTAAGSNTVKVIFETCLLTEDEIIKCCECATKAGARFVKTSTGFSTAGAKLSDVSLMKKNISKNMEVKASGGVRDLKSAQEFINAGATRLGTSSGVAILEGQSTTGQY